MNKIKHLLPLILLTAITFTKISAQFQPGAKQIALANSDVASADDVFSLFGNPAGLSQIISSQVGIFYSPSPFGISELANGFLAFTQPTNFGNLAVGAMNYGFDLFRETRIHLGYSNIYDDKFIFGVTALYQTINIKNYGSVNSINFSLGGIFILSEEFLIGFSIHNPLRNKDFSSLATNFRTGVTYKVLDVAKIHFSVFKELDFPISISSGIEYDIIKYFSIRLGIQNEPNIYSGGIGVNYSLFKFDYSINTHQDLGLTHQIGLIINLSK